MKQTIVFYPSLGISHLTPSIELAKLFTPHNFNTIILLITTTSSSYDAAVSSIISSTSTSFPSISFHHLPPVTLPPTASSDPLVQQFEILDISNPNLLSFLAEFSKTKPVSALILDFFCTSALPVVSQLKIPSYFFFSASATGLNAGLRLPKLLAELPGPLKDLGDDHLHFPGLPPIPASHVPINFHDPASPYYDIFLSMYATLPNADGIIVNTFEALEKSPIDALTGEAKFPPIYCVGPLPLSGSTLHGERHECLSWLDSQPKGSVVFLCFGSMGTFPVEQLAEIANGLEKSGQRFLWVVRNPKGGDPNNKSWEELLAELGFLERTKERGMVLKSWAPQTAVLSHESVGAFVSHCGWNSVLEAVSLGVPIIAWPLYAEPYSNVYRARDLDNGKIVALKKVRFDNLEPESVRFMAREIHILRRLDHPNVLKLEGLVTSRMSCSLYLVFEYMEHDLAGLASFPGLKFTEPQVKCYMQQLLCGLDHCHTRGVLHRDIKGSNLLIDNRGILKIGDFGLASFFDPSQPHPLTSRVVTLWYRPPELLLGSTNYGVAVDLWSTGCILAEMYAGKPIMPGRTEVEQLHKIFKLCGSPSEDYWKNAKLPHATIFKPQQPYRRCVAETFKDFPPPALTLMDTLLSVDPAHRGTAASALKSEFFTTKPLACDPSSLPKYPPSKEFDAKVRDEEARRNEALGGKVQRLDLEKRAHRESRAVPAPDANAELADSMKKWQGRVTSKSRSEKFNPHQDDAASGFPIEPPRTRQVPLLEPTDDPQSRFPHRSSHSGPLVNRSQWSKPLKNDGSEKMSNQLEKVNAPTRLSESGNGASDNARKYDQLMHGAAGSLRRDDRNKNIDQEAGYGPLGSKIHYSGPLLRVSGNVDKLLKDHDRQIQEVSRRKVKKGQGEGNLGGLRRPFDLGVVPVYPSSRGSASVFTSRGSVK